MTRAAALLAAALFCGGCFHTENDTEAARYLAYMKGSGPRKTIWIGDVEGRMMRRLVRGTEPLVAPDGSAIAFHRCRDPWACEGDGDPQLYTIPAEGGEPQLVGRGRFADEWFPDSRHVLSVGLTLDRIDTETGKRTVVARPAGQIQGWSISPDGQRVVYAVSPKEGKQDDCGREADLFVSDVEGGEAHRLTEDGRNNDPVWGEDAIAFAREVESRPKCVGNPASGVWTIRPDGTDLRPIVPVSPRRFSWNGYYGLRPHGWVSGRSLLLAGVRTEWGDELALIDLRSGRIRRPDLDTHPRYRRSMYVEHVSRDGRHVLGAPCGANGPCVIEIYAVLTRRERVIRGRVGSPHWNR